MLPGLAYAAPSLVGADQAYTVLSGSMVPFFHPGDVIFVEKVDPTTLQVGDVITFHDKVGSKTLYTHRIVERLTDGGRVRYITQGDANEDPDPFVVKPEMVEGKYVGQIPWWGLLLKLLRSKLGYFMFILVPGMAIILREGIVLYREMEKWENEREAKRMGGKAASPGPQEHGTLP
ncbi:MAG TPA: signal peptidase I [Candidatus Thermoplasmatota archaeon]|nr:signal peptidase I [Candidatus Thermoplasmatota archaeon]